MPLAGSEDGTEEGPMSPRGVATPDVRERLFAAAERVVQRDGPGALTSRSVTTEAVPRRNAA